MPDIQTYRELWSDALFFFPLHNVNALDAALNRFNFDLIFRDKLSASAKKRAARFTLPRQAAAMQALYDEATFLQAKRS